MRRRSPPLLEANDPLSSADLAHTPVTGMGRGDLGTVASSWRAAICISERPVQRWRRESDGGEDRRRGPNTVPGNKLSEHEERRLLRIRASPEIPRPVSAAGS